jgi:hypothetical protein
MTFGGHHFHFQLEQHARLPLPQMERRISQLTRLHRFVNNRAQAQPILLHTTHRHIAEYLCESPLTM